MYTIYTIKSFFSYFVKGRCIIPATAYLHLVWKFLAMQNNSNVNNTIVEFEDVHFLRATAMPDSQAVDLVIVLQQGTGLFEITENGSSVVTGIVRKLQKPFKKIDFELPTICCPILDKNSFYHELKIRGYHYNGAFKSVLKSRSDGLSSEIQWTDNWVSFLDCALQIYLIGIDTRDLVLPTRIQKIRINPTEHLKSVIHVNNELKIVNCYVSPELNILTVGGVEISQLTTKSVSRRKPPGKLMLESYKFISHTNDSTLELIDVVRVCVQIAFENNLSLKCKAVELDSTASNNEPLIQIFQEVLSDMPIITYDLYFLTDKSSYVIQNVTVQNENLSTLKDCMFIIGSNLLSSKSIEDNIVSILYGGFLLSREDINFTATTILNVKGLQFIGQFKTNKESFVLWQKIKIKSIASTKTIIDISSNIAADKLDWINDLKDLIKNGEQIIVFAQNDQFSGILGLVNCIRKEQNGHNVYCVFVMDECAPPFDKNSLFYKKQLDLNLSINVYHNV